MSCENAMIVTALPALIGQDIQGSQIWQEVREQAEADYPPALCVIGLNELLREGGNTVMALEFLERAARFKSRTAMEALLAYHIAQGESPREIWELITQAWHQGSHLAILFAKLANAVRGWNKEGYLDYGKRFGDDCETFLLWDEWDYKDLPDEIAKAMKDGGLTLFLDKVLANFFLRDAKMRTKERPQNNWFLWEVVLQRIFHVCSGDLPYTHLWGACLFYSRISWANLDISCTAGIPQAHYEQGRRLYLARDRSYSEFWLRAAEAGNEQATVALETVNVRKGSSFIPDLPQLQPFPLSLADIDWAKRLSQEMSAIWVPVEAPKEKRGWLRRLAGTVSRTPTPTVNPRLRSLNEAQEALEAHGPEINGLLKEMGEQLGATDLTEKLRGALATIAKTREVGWDDKRPFVSNLSYCLNALLNGLRQVVDCQRRGIAHAEHLKAIKHLREAMANAADSQEKAAIVREVGIEVEVAAKVMENCRLIGSSS